MCCSRPFLHLLGPLVHSAASSGFYTTKSHKSVSPGQELLGFSSQWTSISMDQKELTRLPNLLLLLHTHIIDLHKSGGTSHPLSPYPCHRTSAHAGPSDPEYTHSYSISCPNTSPDLSGICLAYHCIPITSADHVVGA